MHLDHLILPVNDLEASVDFYTRILGFSDEGPDGPFHAVRVDDFMLLLSPFGTEGGVHLAFSVGRDSFDAAFARLKDAGVPYGFPCRKFIAGDAHSARLAGKPRGATSGPSTGDDRERYAWRCTRRSPNSSCCFGGRVARPVQPPSAGEAPAQ